MSEMVERVARAIIVAEGWSPDGEFEGIPNWMHREGEARAAIAAMREPTYRALEKARTAKIAGTTMTLCDWVLQAEKQALVDLGIPWPEMAYDRWATISEDLHHLLLTTWWRSMIDAALSPEGTGRTEDA